MIIKSLLLLAYINLFPVSIMDAFPVNSSMKEILLTTHMSLSLINLLLPTFQELKNVYTVEKKWQIGLFYIVYLVKDLLLLMGLVELVALD